MEPLKLWNSPISSFRQEVQENVEPFFKKKRNVTFASLKQINDRLKKNGCISKGDSSDCASPIVYIKENTKEICACADFSRGLKRWP